jgi:hypothetical protein
MVGLGANHRPGRQKREETLVKLFRQVLAAGLALGALAAGAYPSPCRRRNSSRSA